MSKISFIHLSDIHFSKRSGNPADLDEDLRRELFRDININAKKHLGNLKGVLVCGDIAFAGSEQEYKKAQAFLESITDCLDISNSSVYCVPGNHDVDQSILKASYVVASMQKKLEDCQSLHEGDIVLENSINDGSHGDVLFTPIQAYNDFATRYNCNLNKDRLFWTSSFELSEGLKLCVHGINSNLISNHMDNKENRKMFIGQAQKPYREDNAINMLLCHHPPEFWKFADEMQPKMNKRAEIQLFGHKHEQLISATDKNLIINSGATHPVRGDDWVPRYNWITLDVTLNGGNRVVEVEIFPRILGDHDDMFVADSRYCNGGVSVSHKLILDKDNYTADKDLKAQVCNEFKSDKYDNVNRRDLVYMFSDMSYLDQTAILVDLELLDEADKGKSYTTLLMRIIEKAEKENKLVQLWNRVNR